jgi:hypothetical protein
MTMSSLKILSRIGLVSLTLCLHCAIDERELEVVHEGQGAEGGTGGTNGGSSGAGGKGATGGSTTGGKGGQAGAGGSAAGRGGTGGGTGGKSGAGNGGSSGGGNPAGGTAGRGGDGGAPTNDLVDCNGDVLTPDMDAVKACLFQIGCDPLRTGISVSFCVTYGWLGTFPTQDCGSGVDSCDDFLACRSWGYYETDACPSGATPYCDGDYAVICSSAPWAKDCAAVGGVCQEYMGEDGNPTAWCRQSVEDACTTSGVPTCAGDIAYTCQDGYPIGTDCASNDSDCAISGEDVVCRYRFPACTTPEVACGTDTRIDVCTDTLSLLTYGCAEGLGCAPVGSDTYCLAPGCEEELDCAESCNGTELTLCYGTTPLTVDCADYGFSECIETTLSDEETPTARCFGPE